MKPNALFALSTTALIALAGPVMAADTSQPPQASITFANHEIDSWNVADLQTLYIQDTRRQWYRADLFAPCIDLDTVNGIHFEPNADGSFDRFSSIEVHGRHCRLQSLSKSGTPPGLKKAKGGN